MSESPISATLRLRRSWAVRLPLSRAMLYAKIRGFAAAAAAALRRRLLGWCTAEQACGLRPGRILHCCRTVLRVKSQSRPHAAGGGFAEAASERSTGRRFGGARGSVRTVTPSDARAARALCFDDVRAERAPRDCGVYEGLHGMLGVHVAYGIFVRPMCLTARISLWISLRRPRALLCPARAPRGRRVVFAGREL